MSLVIALSYGGIEKKRQNVYYILGWDQMNSLKELNEGKLWFA